MKTMQFLKIIPLLLILFSFSANSMNKSELIDAMAKDSGISSAEVKTALNAILNAAAAQFQNTGSTVALSNFRVELGDLPCSITSKAEAPTCTAEFKANGHVTVLKRSEPATSFEGLVSVSPIAGSTALALQISTDRFKGGDELNIGLIEFAPSTTTVASTDRTASQKLAFATSFDYQGNVYYAEVNGVQDASGQYSAFEGTASLVQAAQPEPVFMPDTTLLKGLVTTSYADSFFDIFTADIALNVKTDFDSAPMRLNTSHNKLRNSATYAQAFANYLQVMSPVLIEYTDCVVNAVEINDNPDNDCSGIVVKLKQSFAPYVTEMVKGTVIDADTDGDSVPDTSVRLEFTLTPDRIEAAIISAANKALVVYLDAIEGELALAVEATRNNAEDYKLVLADAAKNASLDLERLTVISNGLRKVVLETLQKGDRVGLGSFGSFSVSRRAARTGRNPQTGATIKIAAKKVAKFKAGKALANTVK